MNPYAFVLDGIWCWFRYGCVFNQFTEGSFYKYKNFHRKLILTYRNWKKIVKLNNPKDIHWLKNKVDFNKMYKDFIGRDWLYSREMSKDDFIEFAQRNQVAIVKPIDNWEGNGIHMIEITENNISELFNEYKEQNVLIEQVVIQHSRMVFNNKSVNTLRVYSIYDETDKKAYIINATLRAGIGNTIVDNSHSGGCSYEVDLKTGRIDSCCWSHTIKNQLFHPGSNICMLGREIPLWSQVLSLVEQAAEMLPSVKFIGWDVAIKSDRPILIEGNHDPDLDIMEFVGHSGYLPLIKKHLKF